MFHPYEWNVHHNRNSIVSKGEIKHEEAGESRIDRTSEDEATVTTRMFRMRKR